MSLSANIDHLAIAAGIEAVVVDTGSREYRGDAQWHRVLDGALDLFGRTDERSIRLVVGKHTIVVQQEGEETVAVVLPTGHAIAKSLRRMIRRMARKDRGPLPKEFLQGHEAAAQPAGVSQAAPAPTVAPGPALGPSPTPPAGGQPSVAPQPKTSPATEEAPAQTAESREGRDFHNL